MTELEAIKYIECHAYISDEVKDMAIIALEKQIPKKPLEILSQDDDMYKYAKCACCRNGVNDDMKYCDICGQEILWGE